MRLPRAALAAGLAVLALVLPPAAEVQAQTQKLRFQASFPSSSLIFENFKFWAERVKAMSGGRLEIEVLPAGTLVPAFEVLDAVHKKVIDGGHTAAAYWVGKHRAATLFGPAPGGPFGMDMMDYMGWIYDGGGLELYRELYQDQLKRDVIPIPMTSVANQVLGWFKRPVDELGRPQGPQVPRDRHHRRGVQQVRHVARQHARRRDRAGRRARRDRVRRVGGTGRGHEDRLPDRVEALLHALHARARHRARAADQRRRVEEASSPTCRRSSSPRPGRPPSARRPSLTSSTRRR